MMVMMRIVVVVVHGGRRSRNWRHVRTERSPVQRMQEVLRRWGRAKSGSCQPVKRQPHSVSHARRQCWGWRRGRGVLFVDGETHVTSDLSLGLSSPEISSLEVVDAGRMDGPEVAFAIGGPASLDEAIV